MGQLLEIISLDIHLAMFENGKIGLLVSNNRTFIFVIKYSVYQPTLEYSRA